MAKGALTPTYRLKPRTPAAPIKFPIGTGSLNQGALKGMESTPKAPFVAPKTVAPGGPSAPGSGLSTGKLLKAGVGVSVVSKVSSARAPRMPSSVAMLVLVGGVTMIIIAFKGSDFIKSLILPKLGKSAGVGGGTSNDSTSTDANSSNDAGAGMANWGFGTLTGQYEPTGATGKWSLPLLAMKLTQAFRGPTTGATYIPGTHRGNDYAAALGTPAYAIGNGVVVGVTKGGLTRVGPGTYQNQFNGAYGPNSVELLTDAGYYVVYGHFSEVSVAKGQRVTAGQVLGNTGSSTGYFGSGPHLHIEITKAINGITNWFSALNFLKTPMPVYGTGGGSSSDR